MPEWPHEYLVRNPLKDKLFVRLISHIRANGYDGNFYLENIRYYDEGGLVYWTMGASLDETLIIYRCKEENTYENRRLKGTLPKRIIV